MMFRRTLSLVLTVQLLATQLLACHCHASACHGGCGSVPHIHLNPSPAPVACEHGHHHGPTKHAHHGCHSHAHSHSHAPVVEEVAVPESDRNSDAPPCQDHDSQVYYLPDGWHAARSSVRPVGGMLVLIFVPPGVFDLVRLLIRRGPVSGVPPDPKPPNLPVYLRTLRLLV